MIYDPKEDSYLMANELKKYAKNKSVIDIGTGSGILAINAKNLGASSVIASDINTECVNHVNSLGIKCIKSDLFSKIRGKFDLIIFNPPYLPKDKLEDKESALSTTGGKRGDEIILRFLRGAKSHLNKEGKILLLISSLTPKEKISKLLSKLSLKSRKIARQKLFFEELYVLKIQNA